MKKPSSGHVPAILDFLQQNGASGNLLPVAERMLEIQQELRRELRRCLPAGVAEDCEVCGLQDGNLVIQVSSPSVASKLRQTLPRLSQALMHQGWKVNAIRLRLQPVNLSYKSEAYAGSKRTGVPKKEEIPDTALEQFSRLAASLEESPLRTALEKTVRRRR